MSTQLNTKLNFVVVSDEALRVAEVLQRNGCKAPKLVDRPPDGWWVEEIVSPDSITAPVGRKAISVLQANQIPVVKYELWHEPKEKLEEPEGVFIPWDDIGRIALVVAKACLVAAMFLLMGAVYLAVAALSAVDPWLVITLPSGEMLTVAEWDD